MSTFMQMGHDTRNLVGEKDLHGFAGIILSPVNRDPADLTGDVPEFRDRGDFEIALDPQLYVPRSDRGSLPKYSYFPADIDSSDLASSRWWEGIAEKLAQYSTDLGIDTLASPAVLPRTWDDEYFALCVEVGDYLDARLSDNQVALLTIVVDLATLGSPGAVLRIASIASRTQCTGCYLVFVCSQEPRRRFGIHKAWQAQCTL